MTVTAGVDLRDAVDPVTLRPKRRHLGVALDAFLLRLGDAAMHALEMPESRTRRRQQCVHLVARGARRHRSGAGYPG